MCAVDFVPRMALQGPLSAMEGTNGAYEPMNGSLGSGTCSEDLVEPQMCDGDFSNCAALKGMEALIVALKDVAKTCTAKKSKPPDGPRSRQSTLSQCSMEKGTKNSPLATRADNAAPEAKVDDSALPEMKVAECVRQSHEERDREPTTEV